MDEVLQEPIIAYYVRKIHVFYLTFPKILCGQKVNNTYARMDWQVTFERKYFFFFFQYTITIYLNILYEYKAGLSDHLTFIVYGKYESLGIWRSSQLAISILSILAYVKLDIQMCECAAWMHDWVTWCLFEHTFTTFLLWWCHLKKSLSLWEKYNSEMILFWHQKIRHILLKSFIRKISILLLCM